MLKDYLSIEVLTLILSGATFVVALITLIYTRNKDKRVLKSLIKRKQVQLKAMEMASNLGASISDINGMNCQIAALKADIEQLKEQL